MAFSDPLVFDSKSHARLFEGLYRLSTSTPDQPVDLIIKNNVIPDGLSTYLIEYRSTKNSTSTVVGAKDDVLRVMYQIKYPPKAFTNAEVKAARTTLNAFLALSGVEDRVLLGER